MPSERGTKVKKNVFWAIWSQLLVFAVGLIVPRFILTSYGSEVNGLLTTVTQIFTYVGLLEAGIGNASLNALYRPLADSDQYKASDIFSATQKYFRKVTLIYLICIVAVSFIYPLCISCELSYIQVFLIIFFQGLSGAVTFFFVAAYRQVLAADGRNYIVSNINLVIYIMTSAVKIALMGLGFDVVMLQGGYLLVHCCQILVFVVYMRKHYPWLERHNDPDMKALSQRSAFLVHEISGTIFSSTDAFVLSTFCNLMVTSIYSVYNMVFVALNSLINALNGGLHYILGQNYGKGREHYIAIHDAYDSLYMAVVFSLFSVAYVLIGPFVNIYTKGVNDIEYVDYMLPILFVSIQLLSCGRATSARLINIAGHAKATQMRSLLEAAINLTVSIALSNVIGIYGVLLGTIIALLYRSNDIIIYANRKILNRSPWKTYSKFLSNLAVFGCIVLIERVTRSYIQNLCSSIAMFTVCGVIFTLISASLYLGVAMLNNSKVRKLVEGRLRHKKAV